MNIPTDHYSSEEEEYRGLEAQVRAAAQVRMDQIAYRMDRLYGVSRAAERLDVSTVIVTRRRKRHRERLMNITIPKGEEITHLPALTYQSEGGKLHATAVGESGELGQISIAFNGSERETLEQVADEISPWLVTLDALWTADQHRTIRDRVKTADYGQAVALQKAEEVLSEQERACSRAHQRAVQSAPGPIPDLQWWTTPRSHEKSDPQALAAWMRERLAD